MGYRAVGFFVAASSPWGRGGVARHEAARVVAGVVTSTSFGDRDGSSGSDRPFRLLRRPSSSRPSRPVRCSLGSTTSPRWVPSPNAASLLFVCFVAPALVVTPLWQRYGTSRDKKRGYLLASLLGGGALALVLSRSMPAGAVYLCVAVVGTGYAGAQMFPMAMPRRGEPHGRGAGAVGLYTGVWTAGGDPGLAPAPPCMPGAGSRWLRLLDGSNRLPAGFGRDRDRARLLGRARGARRGLALALRGYRLEASR